jgi:hypothetical protein
LLTLPTPLPSTDLVMPIVADKTAFIRLSTNRYSVPSTYAYRTLTLVADDIELRLLDGAEVVAVHPRVYGRHQVIECPEHRRALLEEKRQARALKGRDRLRSEPELVQHEQVGGGVAEKSALGRRDRFLSEQVCEDGRQGANTHGVAMFEGTQGEVFRERGFAHAGRSTEQNVFRSRDPIERIGEHLVQGAIHRAGMIPVKRVERGKRPEGGGFHALGEVFCIPFAALEGAQLFDKFDKTESGFAGMHEQGFERGSLGT